MSEDQNRAPIVEAMQAYRDAETLPFMTPAHKEGRKLMIAVLGRYSAALPLLQEALAEDVWDVRAVADDRLLTSTLPETLPDLILVDVGAQESAVGWDIVARLKGHPLLEPVPIILSSDDTFDLSDHLDPLQEEVAAVLVRPCTVEDVLNCVAAARSWTRSGHAGTVDGVRSGAVGNGD